MSKKFNIKKKEKSHNSSNILELFKEENTKNTENIYNEWGLTISLFNHQMMSVLRMENFEKKRDRKIDIQSSSMTVKKTINVCSDIGILSDRVGSGKTLTVVSFLAREKLKAKKEEIKIEKEEKIIDKTIIRNSYNYLSEDYRSPIFINEETEIKLKIICTTVIIANPSIIPQWEDELKKSNLIFVTISKPKELENFIKELKFTCYDVILLNLTRYKDFTNLISYNIEKNLKIKDYLFKRVIYDELSLSGRLQQLLSDYTWIISASLPEMMKYTQLYNKTELNTNFMCRIVNMVYYRHMYKYIMIKNTDEQIDLSYKNADVDTLFYACISNKNLRILNDYLSNDIKLMLAGDDIVGAIEALGGTKEEGDIYSIVIRREEANLAKIKANVQYYEALNQKTNKEEWEKRLETSLVKFENLKDRIKRYSEDDCPICYSELEEGTVILPCCKCLLCLNCIGKIIETKKGCPLCRAELNTKDMIVSSNSCSSSKKEHKKEIKQYTKTETILEIIKKNSNGKFIIYSGYWQSFYEVRTILNENHILNAEVKGSVNTRQNIIRDFKEGKTSVLFLNTEYDGAGINLPETTDIILYHNMSNDIEYQIIGRALRLGRTKKLTVHKLLSPEEKTMIETQTENQLNIVDIDEIEEKEIYEEKENNYYEEKEEKYKENKKTINKKEQQLIKPTFVAEGIYKNLSYLETLDDEQLAIELSKMNL